MKPPHFFSEQDFPLPPTQPATVACKMEAQLEYVHVAYMFFCTLGADLHAQSVLVNKISASELSRKLIETALLVGPVLQRRDRE